MARKKQVKTPEQRLEEALVPREEQPYAVPDNWCWARLGACINKTTEKQAVCTSEDLYIGLENMESGKGIISYGDASSLKSDKAVFHPGQVLYGRLRPYLDKHDVAKVEGICSTDILVYDVNPRSDARYIDYLMSTSRFVRYASSCAKGVNLPRVSPADVERFAIPLPPLAEQRRIVERVEGLFEKLDEVEKTLHDVLRQSEQHIHVLLREAFSGELSQRWRKEHDIDFCSSWKRIKLIEALEGKPRNGFSPKPVYYETGIKTLSLSAVTSGLFRPDCYKYVDIDVGADSHLWLEPGDILLQRSNSLDKVGTSALYTGTSHGFIYPDLMMKLRVNSDIAFAPFVAYQLKTPGVMNYLREHATGTAGNMPKVNQATVCSIPLVLPCKEEQVSIANRLDSLIGTERKSFDITASALSQVKRIRSSVLQLALAGKLGTNISEELNAKESLLEQFTGDVD